MEKKIKHLEMIQSVINRMAGNSFAIKGWCVTVAAAILGFSAKDANKKFILIVFYPIILFWIIDGYFLFQEKLFRHLYDKVRNSDEIDFSMDTRLVDRKNFNWFTTIFSYTLLLFYGIMIIITVFAMFILTGDL